MKFFLTILFISTISYTSIQANVVSIDAFFQKADAFFMKYVKGGLVDYKTLKSKPSDFEELLRLTWNANLTELPPESRKAFWINAYNITCIHAVVKQPNMTSPLDVDGFFTIERHKVAGEYLTLSDIENKKMMDEFKYFSVPPIGAKSLVYQLNISETSNKSVFRLYLMNSGESRISIVRVSI